MADEAPRRHFERQLHFLQARLSPEGYLGLHLTIGMLLIIAAAWCFLAIGENFAQPGALAATDRQAAEAVREVATPQLTRVVHVVTLLGSVGCVALLSCSAAVVFLVRRSFYHLLTLALTMVGGSALNIALKHLFHRARPLLENPMVTLTTYGFPSGHTMGTTMFWGCIAIIVASSARSAAARALAFGAAAFWVAIIGGTRIYLGAHYFTDVIGAIAAGVAWLTFCWTAVETLRRWRLRHPRPSANVDAL
jgi:undecaprenyl-diphosphatase